MGNNPISRIDPNGGSDGGPGDPPTINLDTVVITGHCGSNCGNNTPHIANIDFRSFDPSYPTWTSSFKGNLNDWNEVNGTNFKDPYAAYDYWKELVKQREMNAFMSDFSRRRLEMGKVAFGIALSPILFIGGAEAIGVRTLVKMGIDGSLQYGLTGNVDYADVVIAGFTSPALSPLLSAGIDYDGRRLKYAGHGKNGKAIAIDLMVGYTFYGVGKYGDEILKDYSGTPNLLIDYYNHTGNVFFGTIANSTIQNMNER